MPLDKQDSANQRIRFTHFRTTDNQYLAKSFSVAPDGAIQKTSHAQPSHCIAWKRSLDSIQELPDFLDSLEATDAVATGTFDAPKVRVVPQDSKAETGDSLPVRHRTRDDMRQPAPGLVLLDHDPSPGMPEDLRSTTPIELMARLAMAIPAFQDVSWVGRGSSSQGVFHEKTGQPFNSSGGIHVYVGLNVPELATLREDLQVALWRAGLGFIELARNGRRLRRTIIDLSVLSPERLIFEAAPILGPGVGREVPSWERSDG